MSSEQQEDTRSSSSSVEEPEMNSLVRSGAAVRQKLGGFDFFHQVLKSPKYILAPMVDASELPFRLLCKRYNTHVAWSPMLNSKVYFSPNYKEKFFSTCPEDRPLVVQLCGNDPETVLRTALDLQDHCDAIDLNLGCPQGIAKRGHYGAFLLDDDWDVIFTIVETLHRELSVPVTCKIRVFKDRERTLELAKGLERAGCQLLTVHGRTKEQRGHNVGMADWTIIRDIKRVLSIPVVANGNIQKFEDVAKCFEETGVDAVMSADAMLYNPTFFSNAPYRPLDVALEYLDIVEKHPVVLSMAKGHLHKMLIDELALFPEYREKLGLHARTFEQVRQLVTTLKFRVENPDAPVPEEEEVAKVPADGYCDEETGMDKLYS